MALALLVGPAALVLMQSVSVDAVGEAVKVRAPSFGFLSGDTLQQLKDGRSVRVELVAMVLPGPGRSPAATTRRVFALSYDLWEERFAVTAEDTRSPSVSHLSQAAAEAWCVDQLAIPLRSLGALGRDQPFWLRLEYRVLSAEARSTAEDSRYTLQGLIDALSRRRKAAETAATRTLEAGPFSLRPRGPSSTR
jgi:hypothetical protein